MSTCRHRSCALPLHIKKQGHRPDGNLVHIWHGLRFCPQKQEASVRFDKEEWLASLTAEQRSLLKLEIDTLDETWLAHLKNVITDSKFLDLKRFLNQETAAGRKWLPDEEDVYSWSRHTPFDKVKIVILGSEPHCHRGQSHGLAFSVQPPMPATPSLRNIFRALESDYPTFCRPQNNGGLLTPWANQGVLLLNTCLTVQEGQPWAHASRGWLYFTQQIIDIIAQRRFQGVVFMAWGKMAVRKVWKVSRHIHLVLESHHPSPLSASRGFFDCGHFRRANEWLTTRYGVEAEVDWALVPGTSTKELQKEREGNGQGRQEEISIIAVDDQADVDQDDPKTPGKALDSFHLFLDLPPEIRHHIYLLATPPRFVHVQEWPPPDATSVQKFKNWLDQTLPSQIPIHPSLTYFAYTWRPYLLDPMVRGDLQSLPLRQTRLDGYGFTTTTDIQSPKVWEPSQECPFIDTLWLSEHLGLAWHLCRRSRLYSKAPIPPLLHTCRDSRDFLTRYGYQLAFATRSSPSQTWFHFGRDVLFLKGADWDSAELGYGSNAPWIIGQFMPEHLQRVRRLALSLHFTTVIPFHEQEIHHALRLVPQVEEVVLVNSVLDDAARQPWSGRGTNIKKVLAQDNAYVNSDKRQVWEWVEFDIADGEAESLTWLGLGRLTCDVLTPHNRSEGPIPLIVRNFEQYFDTYRGEDSGGWSRPRVSVVNVGTKRLVKQLLREREAYWQGRRDSVEVV